VEQWPGRLAGVLAAAAPWAWAVGLGGVGRWVGAVLVAGTVMVARGPWTPVRTALAAASSLLLSLVVGPALESPWSAVAMPLSGEARGLVARVAVAALAAWTLQGLSRTRGGNATWGLFAVVVVASLATRVGGVVLGGLGLAWACSRAAGWERHLPLAGPGVWAVRALVVALVVAVPAWPSPVSREEEPPAALHEAVPWWVAHQNPYRARHAARAWARAEGETPGAGHLMAAALERALGNPAAAQALLRTARDQSPHPEVRARAAQVLDAQEGAGRGP
jgi:hypothetical protein